ncbi:MAG TPA: aromatic-ring-hydroxylating dioxygenase subunit beta [Stellaceae bacterium]|nr:aromatic-ring-hydroxylating dioxygenase subunit beta [Stellaceae bacterium]
MSETNLRQSVEDFLFREAELLDRWRLPEWAELFVPDGRYLVAPLGLDDPASADPDAVLFLVADDRTRIGQRVTRLMKKGAHAEYPHSRTRHMISNVTVEEANGEIRASGNFATFRTRNREVMTYMGRVHHHLARTAEGLRIREKRVCLDIELLAPQGALAIIL